MTDMLQQDMMRSSLVLPPLITSPHTAARDALPQTLESFDLYHKLGAERESQEAAARARGMPAGMIADSPSSTLGHSPASVRSSPAMPSPLLLARPAPSRSGGKSPDRRSPEDRKVDMKVDSGGAGGDDIITLFPRRKAGQTRPGGGRGPVVLNLELLEKFYGMPLHVAANRLGICQTAIKKVCRRLGIMKWPYKEMRVPSDRPQGAVGGEGADMSDTSNAASDETTADLSVVVDTPRETAPAASSGGTPLESPAVTSVPKPKARHDDAEVKDAVTALLSLTQA